MTKQSFIEKHNCVMCDGIEYEVFVMPTTNGSVRVIWNNSEYTAYSYDQVIDKLIELKAYSKTTYIKHYNKGVK